LAIEFLKHTQYPSFDKIPEITDFGLLQQSQNSSDHALTFGLPKKIFFKVLQRLNEFVYHYLG
jgi:hypothetical protein